MSENSVRGSDPGLTTKDMIGEIYQWAIVEKAAGLPTRVSEMEKWQNRVMGGVGVLLALNLLDRVAVFLAPKVIEAAQVVAALVVR